MKRETCPNCKGSGITENNERCEVCDGSGKIEVPDEDSLRNLYFEVEWKRGTSALEVEKGFAERKIYQIHPDFSDVLAGLLEHFEKISSAYDEGKYNSEPEP